MLSALLDKYASNGIAELENTSVLMIDPFRKIAAVKKIIAAFGGQKGYKSAVKGLQDQIYAA